VSGYVIDSASGALTPIAGSPFAAGMGAKNLSVGPGSRFLYVSDSYGGTILVYAINEGSGALTMIAGAPFPAGSHPAALAIDPQGKFLYASNETTLGTISAFKIEQNSGALSAVVGSPFSTGAAANAMVIDPSGTFLSATLTNDSGRGSSDTSGKLASYRIDSTTGALKQIAGSPFDAGEDPAALTIVQAK
jgi:6-phosphogluconolactonase (cycloisomerase 2 family)